MRVKRTKVTSSNIKEVGYDAGNLELHILFHKSNKVYIYAGVPKVTFTRMLKAKSIGIYFNTYVKHRYQFKIDG